MNIKNITSQTRRDFYADYECEHCGSVENKSGYDDSYFHQNVIPEMERSSCGKSAGDEYTPLATKYAEHEVV